MTISTLRTADGPSADLPQGSAFEVLRIFARLGVTSFGGPIAHLGYFRNEFVDRRHWLDEASYADLVALCQFLPGPASSQVGFSIGLMRAGLPGAVAAWIGFTLPSALLMVVFACGTNLFAGHTGDAMLHGLKLVAVAIVAQAVFGMARTLCPDRERASIATIGALVLLFTTNAIAQITVIACGGVAGLFLCRNASSTVGAHIPINIPRSVGLLALVAFFLLLFGLPLVRTVIPTSHLGLFDAFYRSGALVFGGGHVVLPLLREAFVSPGWVGSEVFLAGYGAAQAVPGPLFTFAAYLGAVASPAQPIVGAAIGLAGIFLPGMLILLGTIPVWSALRQRAAARAAMSGVNAAVVGILAAALYNPIWTTSVNAPGDFAIALTGFVMLQVWRAPPAVVVIASALAATLLSSLPASIS